MLLNSFVFTRWLKSAVEAVFHKGLFVFLFLFPCVVIYSASGNVVPSSNETKSVTSERQVVELGRVFMLKTTIDIQDFRIADGNLCKAEKIGNDNKAIAIFGTRCGSTTITVWFSSPDSPPQSYIIDVIIPSDVLRQLEKFVKEQFGSTIELVPVPTSQKVLVKGAVDSCRKWKQILAVIIGSGVSQSDMIIQVKVGRWFKTLCDPVTSSN